MLLENFSVESSKFTAGVKPEIFQGREDFVELRHFDKHAPQGKLWRFFN